MKQLNFKELEVLEHRGLVAFPDELISGKIWTDGETTFVVHQEDLYPVDWAYEAGCWLGKKDRKLIRIAGDQ